MARSTLAVVARVIGAARRLQAVSDRRSAVLGTALPIACDNLNKIQG